MILQINERTLYIKNRQLYQNTASEIILRLRVRGTCFPARRVSNGSAILEVYSVNNVDNKIIIDYSDGTGEHEYAFKNTGSTRGIIFTNRANQTTPATVPGTSPLDQNPLHFYQDLPVGVIDTVDNNYTQERDIFLRFEKPQSLTYLRLAGFVVIDVFPSAVAKLKNLHTLFLDNLVSLTVFEQDFYSSNIKYLTIASSGTILGTGFPNWIVNSPLLVEINLADAINLSGSAESKQLNKINLLKDTLEVLNIRGSQINYILPDEINELYKLKTLDISTNLSTVMRLPADVSGMLALTTLKLYATRMPMTEIERIMNELPAISSIEITNSNYNSDYDFAAPNIKVKHIYLGVNNRWNERALPAFIAKLTALETLGINFPGNTTATTDGLREWGSVIPSPTVKTINIDQHTQFTTELPDWFDTLVNVKTFTCRGTFLTLERMDAFVESFYAKIVSSASMATGNTAFRQVAVLTYGMSSTLNALSYRPSGTYQQPAGYVKGVTNGDPASPMEMIWVMWDQYEHNWNYKP